VGATEVRRVDVRVVAATCQQLQGLVAEGRFRQDLYHRLDGVSLWLPPLRERNEEISLLTSHFSNLTAGPDVLEALLLHPWPGNIRQLRQQLQAAEVRARARGAEQIGLEDLELAQPEEGRRTAPQRAGKAAPTLEAVVAALRRSRGNVSRAARELGAHRAQVYRLVKEHGVNFDDFRND
jgi:transcriptional regulator of acetoin/glycerol metabolism